MIDLDVLRCQLKAEQARMMNIAADARRVVKAAEESVVFLDKSLASCHRPDDGETLLLTSINHAEAELLLAALWDHARAFETTDESLAPFPSVTRAAIRHENDRQLDSIRRLRNRLLEFIRVCESMVEESPTDQTQS